MPRQRGPGEWKNFKINAWKVKHSFNQKNSSMLCIGVNKIKIHFDTSQLCCGVVHFAQICLYKVQTFSGNVKDKLPSHPYPVSLKFEYVRIWVEKFGHLSEEMN